MVVLKPPVKAFGQAPRRQPEGGNPGHMHGNRTFCCISADGQIQDAISIFRRLDYPALAQNTPG